jgi:hypothetical protein
MKITNLPARAVAFVALLLALPCLLLYVALIAALVRLAVAAIWGVK